MRRTFILLLLALLMALPAAALAEAPVEAMAVEAAVELAETDLMDPAVYAGEALPQSEQAVSAAAAPVEAAVPDTAPLKLILGAGEKYTLKIDGAAGYKSSNGKVAAVSAKGVVTGVKAGKSATITVTRKKGSAQKIKVTVRKAPSKVTLNKASLTLEVGQTFRLKAKLPSKSASALKWSTGSRKVAKVDGTGLVTAVKKGTTKIRVKTFNGQTAVCTVKVVPVNPANATVRRFAEAAGVTNQQLEKAAGASIETLNTWSADDLTRVEFVTGNVRWKMSDNQWKSVTLTGCSGKPKALTVAARYGNRLPVIGMNEGVFSGNDKLKKVVVEEGIASLPGYAFDTCVNLSDITLPASLTKVGFHSFHRVGENLAEPFYFNLPDNIAEQSFGECHSVMVCKKDSVTAHTLSDGNWDFTCPGEEDFRYRYAEYYREGSWESEEDGTWGVQLALVKYVGQGGAVKIPKGPVYIRDGAFLNCDKLTGVEIPEGVTRICNNAFDGCVSLTGVKFPATLKVIGLQAFRGVDQVKYFDLPADLTAINGNGGGAHTFEGCGAVLRVKKGSDSACLLSERNYSVTFPGEEDFRYRYEKHNVNGESVFRLYLWDYVGQGGVVVIPDGVYGVSRTPAGGSDSWHPAFFNNKSVTGVVIPEGAVIVEDSAFSGCTMLTDIRLPSTLKILKNHAFENTGTAAGKRFIVVLPAGLEEITAGTGAGWDSFNESDATIVAQNDAIRKALYDGWYVYYNTPEDAQNGANLCYKPNDDPKFKYRGCR